MSILQGLFRKTNNNVQLANVPTSNGASSDIDSIRNEISTLKRYCSRTKVYFQKNAIEIKNWVY